ncbi:pseudouridine synthase [Vararia minispora EC-137]|uniref:Pseudouridine synthase n=1 Tax=Vararia minispora EC-137 TaxID=1314806 RepID=A0ACB8QGU5_9AGAM|nr:pseudouridine synthase [Vararia minispora EC-137]
MSATDYNAWSKADLIARLTKLEARLPSPPPQPQALAGPSTPTVNPDFARLPRRKIALRFCYAGEEYSGLAFQSAALSTPTVEGTLFNALARARLVDAAAGPEGCGWERSGRTDRGVSGAGNVVSLWVRSAFGEVVREVDEEGGSGKLRYVHILNLLLPPSIRVLAWSPVASSFSARFATRARHYKYFFAPDGLSLSRMASGAYYLVGEHDFRNLCRVDASKQLTSFRRRILRADVGTTPDGLGVLDLVGSAFLYNQVRHIMAVLFLIGAGLEPPALVRALLNADKAAPDFDPAMEIVDRRPDYQMADALPLVLWDCQYAPEDVQWRTDDEYSDVDGGDGVSVVDELAAAHHRSRVRAALDAHFLLAARAFHEPSPRAAMLPLARTPAEDPEPVKQARGVAVPLGGGQFRRVRKYVPVMERARLDTVEEINRRWREGKGARREARRAAAEMEAEGGAEDE